MLEAVEINVSRFGHIYKDARGRKQEEYLLPKKLTLLLVSGYDAVLRLKIIDRLEELETEQRISLPDNLSDALRLAADLAEESAQQAKQIKRMAPKERAYDLLAGQDGSISLHDAANALATSYKALVAFLRRERWVYMRGKRLCAYEAHLRQGVLEHGYREECVSVLVTPMGLQRLSRRFSKGKEVGYV